MSHLLLVNYDTSSPINSDIAIAPGCDLDQLLQQISTQTLFLEKWQSSSGIGILSGELKMLLNQAGLSDVWVTFKDMVWTSLPLQITHLNFFFTATYLSKEDGNPKINLRGHLSRQADQDGLSEDSVIVFRSHQNTHVNLFDYLNSNSVVEESLKQLTKSVPPWHFNLDEISIIFCPRSLTVKSRFPVHIGEISLLHNRLRICNFQLTLEKNYLCAPGNLGVEDIIQFGPIQLQVVSEEGLSTLLASTSFPLEQNYLVFKVDALILRNQNLEAILNHLIGNDFFGTGIRANRETHWKLAMSLEPTPRLYLDLRLVLIMTKDQQVGLMTRLWLTPDLVLGDIIEPNLRLEHLSPDTVCLPKCFAGQEFSTCRLVPHHQYYTITAYWSNTIAIVENFHLRNPRIEIKSGYDGSSTVEFNGSWKAIGQATEMIVEGRYDVQSDQWLAEGRINADIEFGSLLQNSLSLKDQRSIMGSFAVPAIQSLDVRIQLDGDWSFVARTSFKEIELEIEYSYDSGSRNGNFSVAVLESEDGELDLELLTWESKAIMSDDRLRADLTLS